jgi:nucleoid-associated protein YgaU
MYYQLLIHNMFLEPSVCSVAMEHDKTLMSQSPAYAQHKDKIDEFVRLDSLMTEAVAASGAKVTKLVKADQTEQFVQIQCTQEQAAQFLTKPELAQFNQLRTTVGWEILMFFNQDYVTLSPEPTVTFTSFDEALASVRA